MSLEKWEIELRQQLESVVKETKNKPSQGIAVAEVDKKQSNVLPMTLLFIVLAIGLLVAYDLKTDGEVQNWIISKFEKKSEKIDSLPIEPISPPVNNTTPISVVNELKDRMSKLEVDNQTALDKLSEKVAWNSHRIGLLGIIFNEDFSIMKNNLDRRNIVFLNRDWTLNQMPKCIELTEEDKEYLNKYVKPNQ